MTKLERRLSAHFIEDEFRCPCPCGKVYVDPRLLSILEQLRDLTGRPVIISSGYRCPTHNADVGGTPQSAHLTGEAADMVCAISTERHGMIKTLLSLGVSRIGIGRTFIHVDVSDTLPQGVIWVYGEVV
jgi:uncharacterized protein YcbK (DUF882 family)